MWPKHQVTRAHVRDAARDTLGKGREGGARARVWPLAAASAALSAVLAGVAWALTR